MLKARAVKYLEVDTKQLQNWIKNDFKAYENHHSIEHLISDIDNSLSITKDCINDILELYKV